MFFLVYLIKLWPHQDGLQNRVEIFNEYVFLVLIYHCLILTDINPYAESKLKIGWSMVAISFLNLCFPNLFLVLKSLYATLKVGLSDCYNYKAKLRERKERKDLKKKD